MSADRLRIAAIAGSLRQGSWNRKLLRVGVEHLQSIGVEVDLLDLREFDIPLYDGDLEEQGGLPTGVLAFKSRLKEAQGFLISSPEYNHSIPGMLKNALDWASRGDENVFSSKPVLMMGASTGFAGGVRMLPQLRQVLSALGAWALPEQITLPKAQDAFGEDGRLTNEFVGKQVRSLAQKLANEARLRQHVSQSL